MRAASIVLVLAINTMELHSCGNPDRKGDCTQLPEEHSVALKDSLASGEDIHDELLSAVNAMDANRVELALKHGADANLKNDLGVPVILIAATNQDADTVVSLLNSGADVDASDKFQKTALHKSVESRQVNIAKMLIDEGANINAADKGGTTALLIALDCKYFGRVMFDLLMEKSANPNVCNDIGVCPLSGYIMSISGCMSNQDGSENSMYVVKKLVESGARVEAADSMGITALHQAAAKRDPELIKYLLKHGAKANVKTDDGDLPLDYVYGTPMEEELGEEPDKKDQQVVHSAELLSIG